MATRLESRLEQMARQYRDALDAQNQDAVDRITRSWLHVQQRVNVEVQALISKMEAARLAGVAPSPAWLYQERRLSTLTETIRAEVARWAPYAEAQVRELAYGVTRRAQANARDLAREAASTSLPGVEATFTDLNAQNMATILGHLAPGGPLRDLLVSLGGEAADAAEQALIQGVLLGKGSDWITRELSRALDIPRWRAETIARTEALRTYRETTRQTYLASNVVGSWSWQATLDRRTCPACVVMHGTVHPLTETLDDHPRGRCAMIPRTKSWEEIDPSLAGLEDTRPPLPSGKDWFRAQPDLVQRSTLGPLKWEAWKSGAISLDDVVARVHSTAWGSMRRERSMREIRLGLNANTLPRVT